MITVRSSTNPIAFSNPLSTKNTRDLVHTTTLYNIGVCNVVVYGSHAVIFSFEYQFITFCVPSASANGRKILSTIDHWLCKRFYFFAFSLSVSAGKSPFFQTLEDQTGLLDDSGSHLIDTSVQALTSPSRSSPHSPGSESSERFSRKVFVGGLPPDIDEGSFSPRRRYCVNTFKSTDFPTSILILHNDGASLL